MPFDSRAVGKPLPAIEMQVTPRMALAYSAGIGEETDAAYDDALDGFTASPFFCVTPEWQFVISARRERIGVSPQEAIRAVHAGQHTQFVNPLRVGRRVRVTGSIISVRQTRAGALSTTQMEVVDSESGMRISSTRSDAIYRGVRVDGGDRLAAHFEAQEPHILDAALATECMIPLDRGFAHRYSECASIWNPIHTERRVALAAGLPDTIVHGTALWALAGTTIAAAYASGNSNRLRALGGRFSAMVRVGTPITIRHAPVEDSPAVIAFVVLNASGEQAISRGIARLAQD